MSDILLDSLYFTRNDSDEASDEFYSGIRKAAFNALERDEDAAQDVTLAVLLGLPGFSDNPGSPFSHWFNTIVRNHKADRIGMKMDQRNTFVEFDDAHVPAYSPSDSFMDVTFIKDSTTRRVCELILQGYTQGEAGKQMGLSNKAVSMRLSRLRKNFEGSNTNV